VGVLLGNQIGKLVVKTSSFVHYVDSVTPFYTVRIESRSQGLEEGKSEDLGLVSVACQQSSFRKLNSSMLAIRHLRPIQVCASPSGHQRSYTMSRKMSTFRQRSFHYACDMAESDQTFVTTVADDMRH
jgi:hypothetical protein